MDFDQLKGFYYTAKLRSFTGAAKKLFLTQPAISLKVKALEDAVGEKLLDRVGRKVSLTSAGEILYEQAETLMAKLQEVEQVVKSLQSVEIGRLSLGASDTTSIYFLPELLESFRQAHPGVEMSIESLFSKHVIERILDREVDIGFVPLPQDDKRLIYEPLFAQKFVCIASDKHRFRELKSVKIGDLLDENLILLSSGSSTRNRIDSYLQRSQKKMKVAMQLSSFEIIKRYVAADLGVSLLPERALTPAFPGLCVIPLHSNLSIKQGVVYRADRSLPRPAIEFLAMAQKFFLQTGEPPQQSTQGPEVN